MTCTVWAMFASVLPHSCDPSLVALWSYGFCDPGAACNVTITLMLYFLWTQIGIRRLRHSLMAMIWYYKWVRSTMLLVRWMEIWRHTYCPQLNALSKNWTEPPTKGRGGLSPRAIHHPTGILTAFSPLDAINSKSLSAMNVPQWF